MALNNPASVTAWSRGAEELYRARHSNNLLTAITADGGTTPFAPVGAGTTVIQAAPLTQLRSAIQALWTAGGLGTLPAWSGGLPPGGPSLATAATPISRATWSTCGRG